MDRFFDLMAGFHRGAIETLPEPLRGPEFALKLSSGEVSLDQEPRFVVVRGRVPTDLVPATLPLLLASPRFFDVLVSCGATGWRERIARVIDRNGKPVGAYGLLTVLGRCGSVFDVPDGTETAANHTGLSFDIGSWDGSDLFRPSGSAFTFVSERVALALKRARLSNVSLQPVEEIDAQLA